MSSYLVGLAGSLLILIGIFELLRRRQLSEKYAVLSLAVALVILVLTVFPGLLNAVSQAIGFTLSANLLFFVAIILLTCVALYLSWELSRVEKETRRLAEDLALLRLELEAHKRREQHDDD